MNLARVSPSGLGRGAQEMETERYASLTLGFRV